MFLPSRAWHEVYEENTCQHSAMSRNWWRALILKNTWLFATGLRQILDYFFNLGTRVECWLKIYIINKQRHEGGGKYDNYNVSAYFTITQMQNWTKVAIKIVFRDQHSWSDKIHTKLHYKHKTASRITTQVKIDHCGLVQLPVERIHVAKLSWNNITSTYKLYHLY